MAKQLDPGTFWKIFLIVFSILMAVAIAVALVVAGPLVEKRVGERLHSAGKGKFTVQYGELDLHLLTGSIHLSHVEIKPRKNFPLQATAEKISIGGFSFLTYLFKNEIRIGKIEVERPDISWHKYTADTVGAEKTFSPPAAFVANLEISEGHFSLVDVAKDETLFESGFQITGEHISTDSIQELAFRFFDAGRLSIALENSNFHSRDGSRQYAVESVNLDLTAGEMQVAQVKIRTPYEKYEIARVYGHEVDWVSMDLSTAHLSGIDFPKLACDSLLWVRNIEVEGLNAHLFRDKRPPYPPQETQLYHESLAGLPLHVALDTVELKNFSVTYEEYVAPAPESGHVSFSDIYATIVNVSNVDSFQARSNNLTHASAQAKLMGTCPLQANFVLPMKAGSGTYSTSASGGNCDIAIINPMITKVAFMEIESGQMLGLDLEFTYDDNASHGTMEFQYRNLHVAALDKETGEKTGIKGKLKSLVANMAIKNENIRGDDFRQGQIYFERHKRKSMFNYWWKSAYTGFRTSMGLPGRGTAPPNYN